MICGWFSAGPSGRAAAIVDAMAQAVRSHAGQRWTIHEAPGGLTIAVIDAESDPSDVTRHDPAASANRRFWLWMAGEAYDGGSLCSVPSTAFSRTRAFRDVLLEVVLARGIDAVVRALDGRFQIVFYDAVDGTVSIAVDRFGGLPLYWAASSVGTAFAGGVRGVLMAPGIARDPDTDAIREAVTFGGFRLGTRTNVRGVQRLRGAGVLTVADRTTTRVAWAWPPPEPDPADPPLHDLIVEARHRWQRAIALRVQDAQRPGQTLSGGLDSRAILAEAVGRTPSWTAITYGLDRCDDVRYAQRAAAAAGATWIFHPLYAGASPDWLGRRTSYIQQTDGLMQLSDLLHCESLHIQASLLDVHLSGYIGDVVCGTTYDGVVDAPSLLAKLPFSGVPIGWTWEQSLAWAEDAVQSLAPSAPKFAIYEHKFPQAIHLIFQSYEPYVRVRTPFTDYALFDFFHSLSDRARGSLYRAWLAHDYPAFFRNIPDQRTGVPIGTSPALVNLERLRRGGVRAASRVLRRVGLPAPAARVRAYQDDAAQFVRQPFRARIEETILRRGSISADVFGRQSLERAVADFFDRGAGPVQFIGALYTFEAYHRDLSDHLNAAARAADASLAARASVTT